MRNAAGVLFCLCLAGVAVAAPPASEREFVQAMAAHRKGDMSGAYGRLVVLANEGDPDAARIALFMHRYGPLLYRSTWDAQADDLESWAQVASFPMGRPEPVFVPTKAAARPKRSPGANGVRGDPR